MALGLLDGRFDIDPNVIGDEAFVHEGRSYAYFGVFPALLRIPLVPFVDVANVPLSRSFASIALLLGSFAQAAAAYLALSASPAGPFRDFLRDRLVLAMLLSGPPVLFARLGSVYDEAIAWAWALASVFVALAMSGFVGRRRFPTVTLAAMAAVAGLCLLTRPTFAVGLYASLAALLVWLHAREGARPELGPSAWIRRLFRLRFALPAMIAIAFALAQAGINYARWGDPLQIADMAAQIHFIPPERIPHFKTYGLFNPIRLGYGFIYYFMPVWVVPTPDGFFLQHAIQAVIDGLELPATSFLLSDPLTMSLAMIGIGALLTGRHPHPMPRLGMILVMAGLCIAPTLMMMGWYMAFRYRAEFYPMFLMLACVGAIACVSRSAAWSARKIAWHRRIICGLFLMQLVSSHLHNFLYMVTRQGAGYNVMQDGLLHFYAREAAQVFGAF